MKYLVMWAHRTEASSWWGELVIKADSAEEAAAAVPKHVDIKEHTTFRDKHRMHVRVYGPIPDSYAEFTVGTVTNVEPAA